MAYRNERNRKMGCMGCQKSGIWMQPDRYQAGAGGYMPGMMGMPQDSVGFPGMWTQPSMPNQRMAMPQRDMGNQAMQYGYITDPYMMQLDWAEQDAMDREEQKDMEYWRQMYPEKVRRIQDYVMEMCDREDYDDSFIYDEYPDPIAVRNLSQRIQDRLREDKMFQEDWSNMENTEQGENPQEEELIEMNQFMTGPGPVRPPRPPRPSRPPQRPGNQGNWLNDIVSILLFEELHRRRCRMGRCRRRNY